MTLHPKLAEELTDKYREMKGNMRPVMINYDYAAKDLHTIASRVGEAIIPAEKSHEVGEQTINTLFKYKMLEVFDNPDLRNLMYELESVRANTSKKDAKDDFVDALRYAVTRINWDYSRINHGDIKEEKKKDKPRNTRYDPELYEFEQEYDKITSEIEEANWLYGTDNDEYDFY